MLETPFTPFPLSSVEVTDAYCANALEKTTDYLLSLQEGRLLAGFYENAGIRTPYVRYGGWESGLMGGHTLGHYLSALAQSCVNGGVPQERKERLFGKLKTVVDGLAECQRHSRGREGFIWGAPVLPAGAEAQFDNVERRKTDIKRQAWVPWYTMHKILAGLLDAYRLAGYAPALGVASRLGDWVYGRVSAYSPKTVRTVLSTEYGGMNDALYTLYACTEKPEHALAAHVFDEEELFDRILTEGKDVLKDLHANTTIPKVLGAMNRYLTLHGRELMGKTVDAGRYRKVAESFFAMVTERHTYVTGGNSEWEHFGADYVLDRERTNCNCETCNVYNMLKLARALFCATGDKRYSDYYDCAFTNQILSSQNPETGMTTYFQPMAGGFFKVYSTPEDSFWCCTGSGMESMTKLGDSAYFAGGKNLFVEQYLSSVLKAERFTVVQESGFPLCDTARFTVVRAAEPFLLCMRIPGWAAGEITASKNGAKVNLLEGGGHAVLAVREGDEVALRIPVGVSLKGLPDGKDAFAFLYGGAVLSADLGTEDMEVTTTGVDVAIPARRILKTERVYFDDLYGLFEDPSEFLVREGEKFLLKGGDIPLEFGIHYRRYRERYAIYLRLCEGKRGEEKAEREHFDAVLPGYGQYEEDGLHEMEERNSSARTDGGSCRYARAGGYFSYDFAVSPSARNVLALELCSADNGKPLKITAGGEVLFEGRLLYTLGEERYRAEFPLESGLIAKYGREKTVGGKTYTVLHIRFEGTKTAASARICGSICIDVE